MGDVYIGGRMKQEPIKAPKMLSKAAIVDTGIMFEEKFRVFIMVPEQLAIPPKAAVAKFRWEMHQLKTLASRPSIYDLYTASLGIKEKFVNQESILN